jgi:phospholipase/carboxylesterase
VRGGENPHLAFEPMLVGAALEQARAVAVLVHGRDQDAEVMLDVVQRLGLDDVAYVLPVAAQRSWYPGRYFDPIEVNQPHVDWALEAYAAAVARATEAGVPEPRIVLAGFSQGACLIAELIARNPRPFAGVAVLTGSLLGPDGAMTEPAFLNGLPMYFGASRHDEWVAIERAELTARMCERAGARASIEIYEDRVHHINDRAVSALAKLLTAV